MNVITDSYIFAPSIIIGILFAYVAVVISVFNYLIKQKKEKIYKRKQSFFIVLVEGLRNGSITTIDDIVNIYKGISGLGSDDLDYRYGLSRQLREFLVEVIAGRWSSKIDKSLGDKEILDWKQKISGFIQRNDAISPYADLPAAERNILSDISTFLEKNDLESVKRKTLELAGMIQARNDDLNKIRTINKWTVPLSIIGLILTIIFGVLALK